MADDDKKTTELPELVLPVVSDLLRAVSDVAGTPTDEKVTFGTVLNRNLTSAESTAGLTEANIDVRYEPNNVKRYGAIGDGVIDDTTAIQRAIDVAEAGNEFVYIPAGTYLVSSQLTIDDDDITVFGDGRQSILKTTANINIIRATGADRITVRDIGFLGNSTGSSQDGIRCINVTDSSFHNIYVKSVGHDGILLISGCVGNSISQCHVDGSGDDGINIGGDPVTATSDNTVTGCVTENCTNDGIHVSDGSTRTTITGNVSFANGNGIGLFKCTRVTITGNTISSNTSNGIHTPSGTVSDVAITGNVFLANAIGIDIDAGINITITGNALTTCTTHGIVFSGPSANVVFNSVISGNQIDGFCSVAGVFISGARTIAITGNTISDVTGDGIFVKSSVSFACSDILISNNCINNPGDEGIEVETGTTSEHITIKGNIIRDPTGRGIEYRGGPFFIISDNHVIDAADFGIVISSGSLIAGKGLVIGNIVEGGVTNTGIFINNYDEVLCASNVVYDITGSVGINAAAGNVVIEGNLVEDSITNGQQGPLTASTPAATTPGSVANKLEVFDKAGTSVGFLAIYDAIT